MDFMGTSAPPSIALSVSIVSSLLLGIFVLWQNPKRRTHQLLGVLCVALGLWAAGVLWIVHTHDTATASLAIIATFIVSTSRPALFYHFVCYFPHQKFDGRRAVLAVLYIGGIILSAMTLSPWYLTRVEVTPTGPPTVVYGPVFNSLSLLVAFAMVFSFGNLFSKLRSATGIERRQIEHVIAGIFLSTGLASITNILAPMLGMGQMEPYGPCFAVILVAVFVYSMVRYHLLDIWVLISRSTV